MNVLRVPDVFAVEPPAEGAAPEEVALVAVDQDGRQLAHLHAAADPRARDDRHNWPLVPTDGSPTLMIVPHGGLLARSSGRFVWQLHDADGTPRGGMKIKHGFSGRLVDARGKKRGRWRTDDEGFRVIRDGGVPVLRLIGRSSYDGELPDRERRHHPALRSPLRPSGPDVFPYVRYEAAIAPECPDDLRVPAFVAPFARYLCEAVEVD